MRKKKQILSLLLSMGLFASMFPANALAVQADAEQIDGNIASIQSDETRALTTDISISAEVNGQKVLPQRIGNDIYWFLRRGSFYPRCGKHYLLCRSTA